MTRAIEPDTPEAFAPPPESEVATPETPASPQPELAADTSTASLLEPTSPETVQVLAERRNMSDLYVLVAIDRSLPPHDAVPSDEDETDEGEIETVDDEAGDETYDEPCIEQEDNDDAFCDCMQALGTTADRGWRAALDRAVVRIELARIRERRSGRTLLARVVLTLPVLYVPSDVLPGDPNIEGPSLRVNDVDGDGRVEVTALVPVETPDCDTFQDDSGTLALLLDGEDLHTQAVFARSHVSFGGDSNVNSSSDETVWRAADANGDGHADLFVRYTQRWSSSEPDGESRDGTDSATWTCPYDVPTDRWVCPSDARSSAWLPTVSGATP